MKRGPIVEINLNNLIHNLNLLRKKVNNRPVYAVVKADAYGHGAVAVSKKLISSGVTALAVAFSSEAIELRESGIKKEIIIFFDHELTHEVIKYNLIPVINSLKTAKHLSCLAKERQKKVRVHINVDTGMGRLGISFEDFRSELSKIASLEGIKVIGLMSHFSSAELTDRNLARLQLERFSEVRDFFLSRNINPLCHMANSTAIFTFPESHFDAVRPGLFLYGSVSFPHLKPKPVMSIKTNLIAVRRLKKGTPISYGQTFFTARDSIIGVLPLGYADGLIRSVSNRAEVIVRGKKVPIVGKICMDITMVDLTGLSDVKEEDEVIIAGSQGKETISVEEHAQRADTIPYEILTSFGSKNRKVYTE